METANERINKMRKNASEILNLFNRKIPTWEKDPRQYDKTGYGFNLDSRFMACNPVKITFDSHVGTYGSSSCHTACHLDKDIFEKALLEYMNRNKKDIMLGVADLLIAQSKGLVNEAKEELRKKMAALEALSVV